MRIWRGAKVHGLTLESDGPEKLLPPVLDDDPALDDDEVVVAYCVTRLSCPGEGGTGSGGGDPAGPGVVGGVGVAKGAFADNAGGVLNADGDAVAAIAVLLDALLCATAVVSLLGAAGAPGTPAATGSL
jgi:hypothetical protein